MGILGEIGNTPLVRLERCVPANGAEVWLKLEYRNPSGSMKDRMALAMIEGAERDGLIGPGTTIVEYSGGSTGPALALICSLRGYRCVIVIADSHSEERLQLMRALGAELEIVPSVEGRPRVTAEDIRRMVERAGELAALPDHYATDQFNNPYVVPGFRDGLGEEIWEQTGGRVTAFCQGVGTAGSVIGVAQALKPRGVHICALEPAGSAAISGGPRGTFATQGWTGLVPPKWDPEWVDEVMQIEDHEAIDMTRRLSREEGIFAGITTGANVAAAHRLAERLGPEAVIVTLAVDTGFKYMTVAPFGEPTYATGVVGREEELATIDTFLSTATAGPQAMLLEGEPGIGKSTLWEAAIRGALERSYVVLTCRPTQAEARSSFTGLGDLLGTVLGETLGALPPAQRRSLETALGLREPDGTPPEPRAIGLATLGILCELARSSPVLVAIDDLEWLDLDSAAALAVALRRLSAEPVSLIAARRPSETAALGLDDAVHLAVGPLSLGALHRLLQERLGASLARPKIVSIHRQAGGNPLHAVELAEAGLELAELEKGARSAPLEAVVDSRLAMLSVEEQDVLLQLGALSDPRVSSVDAGQLDRATGSGLVEVDGSRVRFRHPLFASAAYERATPARRRDVHRRLAKELADPEQRARHLFLAAEDASDETSSALEDAARHASQRGATAAAAELAELSLQSTPENDGDAGVRRQLLTAALLVRTGSTQRGRALLEEVLADAGATGHERAEARLLLATTRSDDLEAASDLCLRALIDAGDEQLLRARASNHLAELWLARGDLDRALAHAQAARVAAEALGDAGLLVRALSLEALVQTLASSTSSDDALELARALEGETARPTASFSPRTVLGVRSMFAGDLDEASVLLESDRDAARALGDGIGELLVLTQLAELELRIGRWDEAHRYADRAVELANESGNGPLQAVALAVHSRVSAHAGEMREARTAATRGVALAEAAGANLYRLLNEATLGFVELSQGEMQAAEAHLRTLPAAAEQMSLTEPSAVPFVADAIEAMAATGSVDDARRHVERLDTTATSARARGIALRSLGLVLAAEGKLDEAATALNDALSEHDVAGEPFERARTQLALGRTLRRTKKKRAAREALDEALASFERLGARSWAATTRDERDRIAGRRPSGGLTPTEQRVVALVAEGRSNKEVAAALHVTVKTVEGTLSRVYAKLGVRSRTALARHVADEETRAGS